MDNLDSGFAAAETFEFADFADDRAAPRTWPQFRHPERPTLKLRPLRALHHFRELIKDKEDTAQVFHIFESLPNQEFIPTAKAYYDSERGRAVWASEPYLPAILDDHDALRRMPEGSLAHAYVEFMEREGLTAGGLVDEFAKFNRGREFGDFLEWYSHRQRDTHDMLHILTGYGRDALGEQCVLAFTFGQNPSYANLFIAYAGGLNMKKQTKTDAPVFAAIREAQKLGKGCPKISEMPILELLPMQLEDVRAMLGITPPVKYQAAHARFRAAGVDPYNLLAPRAA